MDCHIVAEDKIDFLPKKRKRRVGLVISVQKSPVELITGERTKPSLVHQQLEQQAQVDSLQEPAR